MASSQDEYVLTEDDLQYFGYDSDLPIIRAARNPDSRILTAMLARYNKMGENTRGRWKWSPNAYVPGFTYCYLQSPLTEAIQAQLPDNVRILLDRGADPNGYPLDEMQKYACLSWRFRPRDFMPRLPESLIKRNPTPQSAPLTLPEVVARVNGMFCFWQSYDSIPFDAYSGGDGMTPIEVACKHDSADILQMVIAAEPDISFWKLSSTEIPDPPTPSSLSVSNPILCAIKSKHTKHLETLFSLGLNPNSIPRACRQQSCSPLMACFLYHNPPDWNTFSKLVSRGDIDYNELTPLTKVHCLHIVVALLSLSDLKRVLSYGFELAKAGLTAFGHTLLHIACLPWNLSYINVFEKAIYESAHELRCLPFSRGEIGSIVFDNGVPRSQPTDFFAAQEELALYILCQSPEPDALLFAPDCHGNTIFHYLAMHRSINEGLLQKLLTFSGSSAASYHNIKNLAGWTADELKQKGFAAHVELRKPFWRNAYTSKFLENGKLSYY